MAMDAGETALTRDEEEMRQVQSAYFRIGLADVLNTISTSAQQFPKARHGCRSVESHPSLTWRCAASSGFWPLRVCNNLAA
jgi:hypothetical protein